jgi:DNA helicase II / ATP-dependent DNA helicase PcrA
VVAGYRYRSLLQAIPVAFYADLHIHSKYSRATSRDADLEHLALWARRKGISVVGTGDFTHPAWMEEIRAKLIPAEPGLWRLRPEIEREVAARLPPSCHGPVRFLLEVEISTIYKKGDKTRKVHHLLYAASLETAQRMREKLGAIGNLASDGRPILGLDSRHLLEIALESGPDAYLVPAHVWTPWFAALGSKSGFDSIEECYGDLAGHIFAVETGLSSDPPMNRRVSRLDRFTLVSNSDAHSPPMLGREACAFETELDYFAIRRALETGEGYLGTVEFFPEEGKYHLDGHRACGVRFEPQETRDAAGLCPACGKGLTVGVMHRVEELADRSAEEAEEKAPGRTPFRSLVPLPEVLSELHGVGPKSRTVEQALAQLTSRLGPELDILERLPLEDVTRGGGGLLAEALARLRAGRVRRESGYDGEYGVIRLFEPGELAARSSIGGLFAMRSEPALTLVPRSSPRQVGGAPNRETADPPPTRAVSPQLSLLATPALPAMIIRPSLLDHLDPEQRAAAEITDGPLLIVAGPGTGKTRTLTHRLAHLVAERGAAPGQCLAVTFSRRAAAELEDRLSALLPGAGQVPVATFHGLGLTLLRDFAAEAGLAPGFRVAAPAERVAVLREKTGLPARRAERRLEEIGKLRRACATKALGIRDRSKVARPQAETVAVPPGGEPQPETLTDGDDRDLELELQASLYQAEMARRGLLDYDDLLLRPLALLAARPDLAARCRDRWRWISIDEYQDIDPQQAALVRLLAPPESNLCAIGDPDQSIYGFRGADVALFLAFADHWPGARTIHLTRNYRSSRIVVEAASQAIRPTSLVPNRRLEPTRTEPAERIVLHTASSERAEAEHVVHTIERLVGGTSAFSFDSGRVGPGGRDTLSFSDIAILYRTEAQAPPLIEALGRAGIPFQKRSHRPPAEQPGAAALLAEITRRAREAAASPQKETALTVPGTSPSPERPPASSPPRQRAGESAGTAPSAPPGTPPPAPPPSVETLLERSLLDLAEAAATDSSNRTSLLAAAELLRPLALRAGADLDAFLAEAAVGGEIEAWDPRAERVSLLTLHAAKGLEFPVVFLVGCEDGLLPLSWPGQETDLAEERRLFFVGLTRARDRLHLSWARRRTHRGDTRDTRPSPFLADLAEDLLVRREAPESSAPRQLRLL